MLFHVYQYERDCDIFVVTDAEHEKSVIDKLSTNDRLKKIGDYEEIGERRAAFNETIAKSAILDHGYYKLRAKSFAPEGQAPLTMPI